MRVIGIKGPAETRSRSRLFQASSPVSQNNAVRGGGGGNQTTRDIIQTDVKQAKGQAVFSLVDCRPEPRHLST